MVKVGRRLADQFITYILGCVYSNDLIARGRCRTGLLWGFLIEAIVAPIISCLGFEVIKV